MLALNQYRSVLSRFYQLAAINILANMMVPLAEVKKQIAADMNKLDSIIGDLSQSSQFFLLDGRGRIIATEDSQNLEKNIDHLYASSQILRQNGTSAVNIETINDSAYFVAYSPIVETRGLPELDWGVILATKID